MINIFPNTAGTLSQSQSRFIAALIQARLNGPFDDVDNIIVDSANDGYQIHTTLYGKDVEDVVVHISSNLMAFAEESNNAWVNSIVSAAMAKNLSPADLVLLEKSYKNEPVNPTPTEEAHIRAFFNEVETFFSDYVAADFYKLAAGTSTADWSTAPTATGTVTTNPLTGTSAIDVIPNRSGADAIDGGLGIDTVTFALNSANYTLAKTDTGFTIQANAGSEGTDTLTNVERLQFADKRIALDLTSDGNAGKAMGFIGAVAPALLENPNIRGVIISLFDQGQTMEGLSQLALNLNLLPKATNTQLANTVFANVMGGKEAPQDVTNALVGYIDSHSQANFLATVASLNINIDLVGLQQTGVEYVI